MRTGQCPKLEQERCRQADGDGRTTTQAGANGDRRAQCVLAAGERLRAEGEEHVEEGTGRVLVHLADVGGLVYRDIGEAGLYGVNEFLVDLGDEAVVVLLFPWLLEDRPWQLVDIPRMIEIDVGECQRYSSLRLGKRIDEEVGSQRDGGSNRSLTKQKNNR